MASFHIHLAVAKEYINKNKIENIHEFYAGTIEPDLLEDKSLTHYTIKTSKDNLIKYLANKVDLKTFLEKEDIQTDYQKAVFIHLITDYIFFNDFFDKEYLENITYNHFCKELYYSYDEIDKYLSQKYKFDVSEFKDGIEKNIRKDIKEKNLEKDNKKFKNILPYNKLDKLIKNVSNIDLNIYKQKILKEGKNVLPY